MKEKSVDTPLHRSARILMTRGEMLSRLKKDEDPLDVCINKWDRVVRFIKESPFIMRKSVKLEDSLRFGSINRWEYLLDFVCDSTCALCYQYFCVVASDKWTCPYYKYYGNTCGARHWGEVRDFRFALSRKRKGRICAAALRMRDALKEIKKCPKSK